MSAVTLGERVTLEACITDDDNSRLAACALRIFLEGAYVKSWSTSGYAEDRPTEEVAFYYSKIAFTSVDDPDGGVAWDNEKDRPWIGDGSKQTGDR